MSSQEPYEITPICSRRFAPDWCPARVDLAGGWLDVPRFAREDGYIVNCAILPGITLDSWMYEWGGGIGGSAAEAILEGKEPFDAESAHGVGWQDPAILTETGLCVWRSGERPVLLWKANPGLLTGRMALRWSGKRHDSPGITDKERDYTLIVQASIKAVQAVQRYDFSLLAEAVNLSHEAQVAEGMERIERGDAEAVKYCGAGHGGYELHLFWDSGTRDAYILHTPQTHPIEPYMRPVEETAALMRRNDYLARHLAAPPMTRHIAQPMETK